VPLRLRNFLENRREGGVFQFWDRLPTNPPPRQVSRYFWCAGKEAKQVDPKQTLDDWFDSLLDSNKKKQEMKKWAQITRKTFTFSKSQLLWDPARMVLLGMV